MNIEKLKDKMATHEQYKTLCISTGDVSEGDLDWLRDNYDDMIMARDTGFIIKLYEDMESNFEEFNNLSHKAYMLLSLAHIAGFRMIEIDADAQPLLGEV